MERLTPASGGYTITLFLRQYDLIYGQFAQTRYLIHHYEHFAQTRPKHGTPHYYSQLVLFDGSLILYQFAQRRHPTLPHTHYARARPTDPCFTRTGPSLG